MDKVISINGAPDEYSRSIWVAPPFRVLDHNLARASAGLSKDTKAILAELHMQALRGNVAGLVFGVVMADGKMELGFSDVMHANPLVAQGIAAQLLGLVQGWPDHMSAYLPPLGEK